MTVLRIRATGRRNRLAAGMVLAVAGLASVVGAVPSNAGIPVPGGAAHARADRPALLGLRGRTWQLANHDLANTRATRRTRITARNVADLAVKWRFPLSGTPTFAGLVASNPVVVRHTTYLIDLNSNVYALNTRTGAKRWEHDFNDPNLGPNGVAYGAGLVVGTTFSAVFALDARTGATVWTRQLTQPGQSGVDMAPQIFGNTVVVSTVPATWRGYLPGAMGIVSALDLRTGATRWTFNTVKDGSLWGHPEINSGGGLWYPPAVDAHGRIFLDVGNPAPFPGTPDYPNGSSRPGPNLYTDSLVALDARTGRLLWYRQVTPHDVRDYDLEAAPIIAHVRLHGAPAEVVIAAGKAGLVRAYRADNGAPVWSLAVGRHLNDIGPLPATPTEVYPGPYGGVLSSMALSRGVLFVPWIDLAAQLAAGQPFLSGPDLRDGRGGLVAVDAATGRPLWTRHLDQMPLGAATVANNVVFTSTYDGKLYAFDVRTGRQLWTATADAGINSPPAVAGDMLIVGAAAPGFTSDPKPALVAYALHRRPVRH